MFKRLGVFIQNNPIPIILLAFLLIIVSIQGAQQIEMGSGTETFVEKNSRLYQDYDHLYLRIFSTQSIAVLVEGSDVQQPAVLRSLDILERQALNMPGVVRTSSAASVIRQANYQLIGRAVIPDTRTDISSLASSPEMGMLMPDRTHALLFIEMAGDSTDQELIEILRETEYAVRLSDFPPDYTVIVTGDPAFMIAMQDEMNSSMAPLLLISVLLMVVVLYLVFRHVRWKILPLPIVLLGIIYTFGAMGFLHIPLSMVSMSAFPILIGLGIDYAIQFHNRIEEELEKGGSEADAVIETIQHTGPAVLIAVCITALGFISLFISSVPMIQDFGKLLLIGIVMCFLSSLFVGVTVIYGMDILVKKNHTNRSGEGKKERSLKSGNSSNAIERFLEKITAITIKHPGMILGIAILFSLSGFYVDSFVPIQTDVQTFVPQDMPALVDLMHLGDIIGGSDALNLIIKVDDAANPEVLRWIDDFSTHEVERRAHIYGASSIVNMIKSFNAGKIPDNSDDVERLYQQMPVGQKDRFIHGKNTMLLNLEIGNAVADIGLEGIEELDGIVQEDIAWMPPPPGTDVTITGNSVAFTSVIGALTTGRVAMTLLGLVMVFGGLLVIYRDYIKALTPVVTMFMVIGWSGGIMYFSGLEYTPMTATLGALILGVGSEYAVLMMERYFEEKGKGAKPVEAIRAASSKIGKAIVASGLTTIFGFSALMASPFSMNRNFGMVTVIDVALALLASFIVFPAVLVQLDEWRERRKTNPVNYSRGVNAGDVHYTMKGNTMDTKYLILASGMIMFIAIAVPTASANNELLNPNYAFSTNYYDSYGEPELYSSLVGDPEFQRGETARMQVNLVNKGALKGFRYRTSVGTNQLLHAQSLQELEYESMRTAARGIEVQLRSDSPFIKVESDTSVQTIESLVPGELTEDPLAFTITISNNAPSGMYYLQLPVSYEYQDQVRMTKPEVMRLGITALDHTVHYTVVNTTLAIPVYVRESARFKVVNVTGHLVAGKSQTIEVIYQNIGEKRAAEAIARIVAMQPITVGDPIVNLGTIEPGERRSVSFEIGAQPAAVSKIYALDSEIKYRNDDDEIEISDNLKVSVPLEPAEKKVTAFMLAMAGVIVLLIYLIMTTLRKRKI